MDVVFDILSAVILCYSVAVFNTHICGNTLSGPHFSVVDF